MYIYIHTYVCIHTITVFLACLTSATTPPRAIIQHMTRKRQSPQHYQSSTSLPLPTISLLQKSKTPLPPFISSWKLEQQPKRKVKFPNTKC